jgi:integrase
MGKRRTHGEGTIYFHKGSGLWCAEATYWDGTRLRKKPVYGKTKKEVSEKLQKVREQLRQGITPPPEKVTVADYLAQWLAANQTRLRPTTVRRYQQIVRHQILPELGRQRVSTLTPTTVEQWLQKLAQQNLAPRTLQQCRAVLRRALQDAVRDGLCVRNAAALARPIPVPSPATTPWDAEEA